METTRSTKKRLTKPLPIEERRTMNKQERRIVILDKEKCNPKKCNYECINVCPVERTGKDIFSKDENGKPKIQENLCIGCGICVKHCPFDALTVVKLPTPLEKDPLFRYGPNAFALYQLPRPSEGQVVGILGNNGLGKSTALKILSGLLKPNFGKYDGEPSEEEVIQHFRGTTLQNYFTKMYNGKITPVYKPQYVSGVPKKVEGNVRGVLEQYDERGNLEEIVEKLGIEGILDRKLQDLSGGELQKLVIASSITREGDFYFFDEPSSFLDVSERIRVARVIRELLEENKYVMITEHDLAVLDYSSDLISIFYGEPGAYGVATAPQSVRRGINSFLMGYIPGENIKFRSMSVEFQTSAPERNSTERPSLIQYPKLRKSYSTFSLEVTSGELREGEVVGILGRNGIGKTTFIKLLAGKLEPDEGGTKIPKELEVSYKPQYLEELLKERATMTVRTGLRRRGAFNDQWFKTYVSKPLGLKRLFDLPLGELSGGELQKVAIAYCLAKEADIYLLDEPSAYISAEERYWIAKAIREVTKKLRSTVLVVEHDLLTADYLTDRLIVFKGDPGKKGIARKPMHKREGMNTFLSMLGITFRRDDQTGRPRINKVGSRIDELKKRKGEYYYALER